MKDTFDINAPNRKNSPMSNSPNNTEHYFPKYLIIFYLTGNYFKLQSSDIYNNQLEKKSSWEYTFY